MPAARRILSLWFAHFAAELAQRRLGETLCAPLVVTLKTGNLISVKAPCAQARALGITSGQSLADARVICEGLRTQPEDPLAEASFLRALARWAERFSPWIAAKPPDALMLDITGCAHLFGGETGMAERIKQDCEDLGLTPRIGIADSQGAAWALARFGGHSENRAALGNAIDQEARATRARAFKRRRWERGGPAPLKALHADLTWIAQPGDTFEALAPLPLAALRLPDAVCTRLARIGITDVAGLASLPRATIGRRYGADILTRLDQALGSTPEPISPARPVTHFACRISFPDPIGLSEDIAAGMTRLLIPLGEKLRKAGLGARQITLDLMRSDQTHQRLELNLANPTHDPDRIEPLLRLYLPRIEPRFGIDVMRLEASVTEPVQERQHQGPMRDGARPGHNAIDDLISRLGTRVGLDAIQIAHPADSHIPEKTQTRHLRAYKPPAAQWPQPVNPRPLKLFAPEPIRIDRAGRPPRLFRWRRQEFCTDHAIGPERIAPEWWLDDPNWRSGTRDYWVVTTRSGERLWLFQAHGGAINGGWFCQGDFC